MTDEKTYSDLVMQFIGLEVTITTNLLVQDSIATEAGPVLSTYPLFYEGILLDEDNQFLYLGDSPNEISAAVKKRNVVHISLKDNTKVFDAILEAMGPEGPIN